MSLKRVCLIAAALAMPLPAAAEDNWEYTATFYGWFPGHETEVETPFGDFQTEVEFDEILENLDLAAFGAFEARKGPWSFLIDGMYADLSSEVNAPFGTLFSKGEIESQATLVSAYVSYAVLETEDALLHLGGGVRYSDVSFDSFLVGEAPTPNASFSNSGDWADLLLAARLKYDINDRFFTVAYADVGGFGIGESSDLTWQASIGLGVRINKNWATRSGYRHLSLEREFGPADVSTEISGPFFGLQASF